MWDAAKIHILHDTVADMSSERFWEFWSGVSKQEWEVINWANSKVCVAIDVLFPVVG